MRRLLSCLLVLMSLSMSAQTLHTIMMCNKNDRTLARGNEGEVREMQNLIPVLASKLGYKNNMIVHSGQEFTYSILNQEINSLSVSDGDIVLFYYATQFPQKKEKCSLFHIFKCHIHGNSFDSYEVYHRYE